MHLRPFDRQSWSRASMRMELKNISKILFWKYQRPQQPTAIKGKFAPDDLLEAFAALRTAERIAKGGPLVTPPNPRVDRFGLRIEIVASRRQESNDGRMKG